ncbi:hypothetical protein TELCIR_08441 [Teladorsagia circumcincta]|uniref:Uncharacterized protein n=1 Tax=Teladorsagia circumcincta TaxID=45464 RepID=A0A2G9UHK5_TELCI|nr:hypothetical protein TELCIR_08441 [Teladorsagia circumcincta]
MHIAAREEKAIGGGLNIKKRRTRGSMNDEMYVDILLAVAVATVAALSEPDATKSEESNAKSMELSPTATELLPPKLQKGQTPGQFGLNLLGGFLNSLGVSVGPMPGGPMSGPGGPGGPMPGPGGFMPGGPGGPGGPMPGPGGFMPGGPGGPGGFMPGGPGGPGGFVPTRSEVRKLGASTRCLTSADC